ncbi:uncharacterized protein LOC130550664 [Triplophysa rosa]|uniref:uncharacterized protein LOC130550664 n=1 Tax=Triplophysa rosa TaxID=992332 RepID=UPI002545D15F|nr:uncharacterized protein LOC130550664 [Triplophysa rosa]
MATRKTAPRGRKPRTGLRSQVKPVSVKEEVWSMEDEGEAAKSSMASPKSSSPLSTAVASGAVPGEGFLPLMRKFLEAQEQREERYVLELRGLHDSIVQTLRPAATSPDVGSVRMDLPTPAAQRVSTRDQHGSFTAPTEQVQWPEPKIRIFQQGEDIENYLRRFKRLAKTWKWPEEEWSFRLVPLLTGRALEAYLAMDEEGAEDYKDLKEALLEKFNISPETYRQRFRSATVPAGESPMETYHWLKNLYRRWVRP